MRLRDFQLRAPGANAAVALRLTVMSEVVVHWLRASAPLSAPFAKLVVSLYRDVFPGANWINWPGGIGELRATGELSTTEWHEKNTSAAVAAILEGLEQASMVGAEVNVEQFRREIVPLLMDGPPYQVDLERLAFRDPSTHRTYRVLFRFSPASAEVVIAHPNGETELVRSESFLDTDAIFPVVRTQVTRDKVRFLARSGSEFMSVGLDELRAETEASRQ